MTFKMKVTGFQNLDHNLKALARQLSPQVGIVDSLEDGAILIALQAQRNAEQQGLLDTGDLIRSITTVRVNQYRVDIKVGVPYGAAHEFGVTVTITPKQRRFFWAKHIETGDDMWKALALSATYTIPARPYLRPAMDEKKAAAAKVTAYTIGQTFERQLKSRR